MVDNVFVGIVLVNTDLIPAVHHHATVIERNFVEVFLQIAFGQLHITDMWKTVNAITTLTNDFYLRCCSSKIAGYRGSHQWMIFRYDYFNRLHVAM